MKALIVSDVHVGSPHFLCSEFRLFLKTMPSGFGLILNGDIVCRWVKEEELPVEHKDILSMLVSESEKRRVVWVTGNHDRKFRPSDPGKIEFVPFLEVDGIYIAHGHDFDVIRRYSGSFVIIFRFLHALRVRFGAEFIHVAHYAKKFKRLYGFLRRSVMRNAVKKAKERRCHAVVCGHTHYAEDLISNGIRYVNTGSWTEKPLFFLSVDGEKVKLSEFK